MIRAAARWVRRLPDRLLHPHRYLRARERLAGNPAPGEVLFVCQGNICRSPYAEVVFRQRTGGRIRVGSAGLMGPDRRPPDTALEVAAERGHDLGEHRSRLVTAEALADHGLVVVMTGSQARELERRYGYGGALVLGDLDPTLVDRRPIRDPVFGSRELFHEVYARVDRCVGELTSAMGGEG